MNATATIAALSFLLVIAAATIACAWMLRRADRRATARITVANEWTEADVKQAIRSGSLSSLTYTRR